MSLRMNPELDSYGMYALKVEMENKEPIEIALDDFYKSDVDVDSLYIEINGYLAYLDVGTQEAIFSLIQEVDEFNQTCNYGDYNNILYLESKVRQFVDLLNLDEWREWHYKTARPIPMPDTVNDTFSHNLDMGITEEKTYVTSDYAGLVYFVAFLRAIGCIYSVYLRYVRRSTKHPHYAILRLFNGSYIDRNDNELAKLKRYIEANFDSLGYTGKKDSFIISSGLSDDDVIDYLAAEIIFNKLLPMDAYTVPKKGVPRNFISYAFQTIKYKGKFNNSANSRLRASAPDKPGREDYSYFEDYRKTTSIPIGTVVELQHALSDPVNLAVDLGYDNFDFEMYNEELREIKVLIDRPVENVQLYILGWFLSKAINPRALFHLERRKIAELRIFAKVALLATEHSYMGIFLTSYRNYEVNVITPSIYNTINKDIFAKIKDEYKWAIGESGKLSVIEETISETVKSINNVVWMPTGSLGGTVGLITKEGYLDTVSNINDIVTSYVAYLVNKNKT